jgi:uncharacterized HAD superfamily protein
MPANSLAGVSRRVSLPLFLKMPTASAVGEAIVRLINTPFGQRPFRVHIDPAQDGAEVVNMVCDRVRAELLRRIGLEDVLTPAKLV